MRWIASQISHLFLSCRPHLRSLALKDRAMLYCLIGAKRITSRKPFSLRLSMNLCRLYASRGKPVKKPPSEITTGSEGAPTEDKIKKKTKRVSRAAPKEVQEPVKIRDRKTTLEV